MSAWILCRARHTAFILPNATPETAVVVVLYVLAMAFENRREAPPNTRFEDCRNVGRNGAFCLSSAGRSGSIAGPAKAIDNDPGGRGRLGRFRLGRSDSLALRNGGRLALGRRVFEPSASSFFSLRDTVERRRNCCASAVNRLGSSIMTRWNAYYFDGLSLSMPASRIEAIEAADEDEAGRIAISKMGRSLRVHVTQAVWQTTNLSAISTQAFRPHRSIGAE
jgi:hypothetical protein